MRCSGSKSFGNNSLLPSGAACLLLSLILLQGMPATSWAQAIPEITESATDPEPEVVEEKIVADDANRPSDDQISSRLTDIFANLPGLETVSVRVNEGIIFLEGSVEEAESLQTAQRLAERLSGAVTVINNIQRDRTLGTRMKAALNSIELQFKDFIGNAPLLLLALFVVGLGWFFARLAARGQWLFDRLSSNWFVQDMLRQVVQLAIFITGVIVALRLLDATALLGSLLGAVGIIGLAVGFATRDTVENYIASMLLSLRKPFEADDYVDIEGVEGKVLRLTPRATILMSLDGNHQRVPNAKVYKATIINYTRNPLRRFVFDVGVDTEADLTICRSLAVKTIGEVAGVLQDPSPLCLVETLGDSSVILRVQGWLDQRKSDFQKVRSEAQQQLKEAFDKAGIIMPEPIYNVNLRRQTSTQAVPQSINVPTSGTYSEDTRPDQAVEEQMRNERRNRPETDLLSQDAKSE